MNRKRKARSGGLVLAVLLSAAAGATTAARLDVPDLTREADVILIATAGYSRSVRLDGDLITLVNLEVAEVLKGAASGTITLVLPGGIDVNRSVPIVTTWPGQPRIDPGERVLLFLREVPAGAAVGESLYFIVGFSQGKFSIDGSSAAAVATQNLVGLHLAEPGDLQPGDLQPGGIRTTSLSQLRRQIQQALAAVSPGVNP